MTPPEEWGDPEPFGEDEDGDPLFWTCPNPECSTQKTSPEKAAAHCRSENGDSSDTAESEPATDVSSTSEPEGEGGESGINPTTVEEISVPIPEDIEIVREDGELLARQEPDPETGLRTDPAEFARYYDLLMADAPEGYVPHLLRCAKGEKGPALQFGSWKAEENRLDRDEAIEWLKEGGNVGIAGISADEGDDDGVETDELVNMDIDDREAVPESEVKPTLGACSRSRIGDHGVYFDTCEATTVTREIDGEELSVEVDRITNIAPDCGEIRTDTQYVVAPGSHVPVVLSDEDDPDLCDIDEDDRENIGRYTVEREEPAARISYTELPSAYREHHEEREFKKAEREANAAPGRTFDDYDDEGEGDHERERDITAPGRGGTNDDLPDHATDVYDIGITDATGLSWGYRGTNPIGHHNKDDEMGEYFVLTRSRGDAYDHKDDVSFTPASFILADAGERDPTRPNGPLSLRERFVYWKECKERGLVDGDDPIPLKALFHVLVESDDTEYEADDWVYRSVETGETVGTSDEDPREFDEDVRFGLPPGGFNTALDLLDEADVDHGREQIDSGESVEPVPTIPFAMLSRPHDELVRYARKRGLEWPETDEARDRLGEAVRETFRDEGYAVLDAPTGLGKTYEASTTFWRQVDEAVTGGQPVVLFASTTDARDEAKRMASEAGLDVKMLLGYKEACDVAGGVFDPENVDESDDRDPLYINGVPAGQWFENHVEGKGIAVSSAHSKAERLVEQGYVAHEKEKSANGLGGAALPCCPEELKCKTETQWPADGWADDDGVPRYDLVVATDPFAYVPGLRASTNVVHDEQPDYTVEFGESDEQHQQRIQRIVTAFLKAADAPAQADTFGGLVQVAKHGFAFNEHGNPDEQTPMGERYDNLFDALDTELPRDWFFECNDAHTLAPALAKAIYKAAGNDPDENGRRSATVSHDPPRLDADASDDDAWNRTWVTVVLDDEDGVATVRDAPDFSTARSVVGLDAWPNPYLWQRNVHPDVTPERVLDTEERSLWRRLEQGKLVVGVGDATRPAGKNGKWFTESHADAIISQLREEFGDDFQAAGCAKAVEDRMRQLLDENGVDLPDDATQDFTDAAREAGLGGGTITYGAEKSRNDLADHAVGLVYGCIDPGDDYVLDLAAECDLDVQPARHECPRCDGDGCGASEPDCLDGTRRTHGREFVGEDGEDGAALLSSVRENHVAQMAGRFGRAESVDQSVVFVATDATPPGLVDVEVPGVLWLARPNQKQRELVEHLRANPSSTAREASDVVDCSKEHARQVFAALVEQDKATVHDGEGDHGADVYRWLSGASASATPFASVDLTPEDFDADTANSDVWSTYTWQLAISPGDPGSALADTPSSPERPSSLDAQTSITTFDRGGPPPDNAD